MSDNRTTKHLMTMLEERGVKHKLEHDLYVEWVDARGNDVTAFETSCKHKGDVLIVHVFLTPEQAIAVTLGKHNVTNNQESIVCSFLRKISPNRDWDYLGEHEHALIADLISNIAATLGSDDEYEAKMDELLCRLTNGKWSKSRAYSIEFMVSCVDEEFEALYSEEQFSAPVSGTLTAKQVRKAIFDGSSYASYDGVKYYADGIGIQAIADELNAELGSGTCEPNWVLQGETQTQEFWSCECGNCGECFGVESRESFPFKMTVDKVDTPNFCPNCGAKVVGK